METKSIWEIDTPTSCQPLALHLSPGTTIQLPRVGAPQSLVLIFLEY